MTKRKTTRVSSAIAMSLSAPRSIRTWCILFGVMSVVLAIIASISTEVAALSFPVLAGVLLVDYLRNPTIS